MNFILKSDNIDDIYRELCNKLDSTKPENGTKELLNASFELTNLENNIINICNISKEYLFGELTWYLSYRDDIEYINNFSDHLGRKSDNGITANSSYGNILFVKHNFNQVDKIIELLKHDKNSRRAVLNLNVPNQNVIETCDEICTIALQFYIRDNKLYCTTMMRSNDAYNCLPYDLAFFTELQKYIARQLNIETGSYTHFAVSLHTYFKDFNEICKIKNVYYTEQLKLDNEKLFDNALKISKIVAKSDDPKNEILKQFIENKIII